MKDYQLFAQECIKCAKCIQHCTMYKVHRDEVHSPRGLLELISSVKKEDLTFQNALESCFLCGDCSSRCPKDLPIDFVIKVAKSNGKLSLFQKVYFYLLRHQKIADLVFSCLAFLPSCLFKSKKIKPIFKLSFTKKSFLNSHRSEIISTQSTGKRVMVFVGCLINYNFPKTGEALLKILDTLGYDVLLSKQECCGAPALFSKDINTAKILMYRNLENFEKIIDKVEAILIPEATCASVMIKDWKMLCESQEERKRLDRIVSKMYITSEWLSRQEKLFSVLKTNLKKRVAYHDPCHSNRAFGIFQEPRKFLSHSYDFIELDDSQECCGFGGVGMQLEKNDEVNEVGRRKAKKIAQASVDIVSAECSACRVQITNQLQQIKNSTEFKHHLELIAEAL